MSISHNLNTYSGNSPVWRVPLHWNSAKGSFFLTTAEVLSGTGGGQEGRYTNDLRPKIEDSDLMYHQVNFLASYFDLMDNNSFGNLSAFDEFWVELIGYPIETDQAYILSPNTIINTLGGQGIPLNVKYRFTYRDGTTSDLKVAEFKEDKNLWHISMTAKERYEAYRVDIAMSGSDNSAFFQSYLINVRLPGSTFKLAFPPTNLDANENITEGRRSEVRMVKQVNGKMIIQNGVSSFVDPCMNYQSQSFGTRNVGISNGGFGLDKKVYEILERTYMYSACPNSGTIQRPIMYTNRNDALNMYYDLKEWFEKGGSGWENRWFNFSNNCPLSTGIIPTATQEMPWIRYTIGGLFKCDQLLDDTDPREDIGVGCVLGYGTIDYDINLSPATIGPNYYTVKKLFQDREGDWYYYFEAELTQEAGDRNLCTVSTPVIIYRGSETNLTLTYLSAYITLR